MKKQTELNNNVHRQLLLAADKKYKVFSESLIPGAKNILGVRTPVLRKIAKDIYQHENWQEFLQNKQTKYFEETMLQGMIVGLIQEQPKQILKYVADFVPRIDNWAVCDIFCSSLKFASLNKALVWKFIQKYLKSKNEFEVRFAVVLIIKALITVDKNDDNIDKILLTLEKIHHRPNLKTSKQNEKNYYAKMAIAWAISICFIKQPSKTLSYLKKSSLDKWTFNKAIQKITESYRVDKYTKNRLKELKNSLE